jgi:pimeloyl-ACP methyl ester carboxylesterase
MFFETNGVNMAYYSGGSGPPVLLLHGWGTSARSMRPVFDALCKNASVYAVDFPGHGESEAPQTPWTVDDFADAVLAFIKALGIMGCDVVAHSFGARVVIKLAARDEGIFSRVVLTGAAGVRKRRTAGYYARIYAYKIAKRLSRYELIAKTLKAFGVDVRARVARAGSEDYRALPESMKRTFSLVVNENLRGLLPRIKNPTLLIFGDADESTPLWMAKVMEREIPDCGLVVYPGAGHYAFVERLPQFLAVVSHFFGIKGEA